MLTFYRKPRSLRLATPPAIYSKMQNNLQNYIHFAGAEKRVCSELAMYGNLIKAVRSPQLPGRDNEEIICLKNEPGARNPRDN